MSKIQPVVTEHHPEGGGGMHDVLSIQQRENGNGTKILGKSDISKQTVVWLLRVAVGGHRRTIIERRTAASIEA